MAPTFSRATRRETRLNRLSPKWLEEGAGGVGDGARPRKV